MTDEQVAQLEGMTAADLAAQVADPATPRDVWFSAVKEQGQRMVSKERMKGLEEYRYAMLVSEHLMM